MIMETAEKELWIAYLTTRRLPYRQQLITLYYPLIKYCAAKLWRRIGKGTAHEWEDLLGLGAFGLLDAVEKFSMSQGHKFNTYATTRISGAMIDGLRSYDEVPRQSRQRAALINSFTRDYENLHGEAPTLALIAAHTPLTIEQVEECLQAVRIDAGMQSTDDEDLEFNLHCGNDLQPESIFEREELRRQLFAAMAQALTDIEQKVVIAMHFVEGIRAGVPFLAKAIGLTDSRLYQIHQVALLKLRNHLTDDFYKSQLAA